MTTKPEKWISPQIIARRLGVSVKTSRRLIDEGQFVVAKFGGSIRVSESSFNSYVDRMVQIYKTNKDA